MKEKQWLIQMGPDEEFYLDEWNGDPSTYGWTPNRKTAWHMRFDEANQHLERVKTILPDALVIEA